MNNLDKQYTDLLQDILDNGVTKQDRTGTGTLSLFGKQIRHKMSEGFPLLTTKKMPFKLIATELIWFLRGDTNIKFLVDNNCHIWDGDAYKNYEKGILRQRELQKKEVERLRNSGKLLKVSLIELLPKEEFINKIKTDDEFAKKWGDLGPVYGKQWRSWNTNAISRRSTGTINEDGIVENMTFLGDSPVSIDQIANLINDLKTNPDSRRLMVNAWNVGELDQMVLPPCHYGFQVYTRELNNNERIELYTEKITEPRFPESLTNDDMVEVGLPTRAISLMWNQRSVDTFLGLPFNIASYGLLLEIIAKAVNMVPDELIGNLGDTHLYLNHIEQAKEQIGRDLSLEERQKLYEDEFTPGIQVANDNWLNSKLTTRNVPKRTREPFPLPTLGKLPDYLCKKNNWECYKPEDIKIENYQSHPHIKAPLSN
jgi:thymidylate synthase